VDADLYAHPAAAAVLVEALTLLGDGVPATAVESAALEAGMPAGPLWVLDALSLEVVDHALHDELHALEHAHDPEHRHGHACGHDQHGAHAHDRHEPHDGHGHAHGHAHGHGHGHESAKPAHRHTHAVKSRRMPESAVYVLEKMAHGYRRLGRAGGGGFYDYASEPPQLWSGLKTFERRGRHLASADIRDRLLHAGLIAAIGASAGTAAGQVPAIFGGQVPGDAAQARALLQSRGQAACVARMRELASRFGPRFEPPASIAGIA
jgi:hypothetical protein